MERDGAAERYQPVDWRAAEGRHPPEGSAEYDFWQKMRPLEHTSPDPFVRGAAMEFQDTGVGRPSPAETQEHTRPLPIGAPFDYDCIVVVIAHSVVRLSKRLFGAIPPGYSLKTIQVANIDGVVHGDSLRLREMIYQIFEGTGLVGETPETILKTYLAILKLDSMQKSEVREQLDIDLRYRDFYLTNGNASTNYKEYYNKTFIFAKWVNENGCVLLIKRDGSIEPLFQDVIAESIKKEKAGQPANRLTKRQILAEVFKRFHAPLFLDVGCCEMELADDPSNDVTIDEYVEWGTLGGKKSKRKKKKSYRSKKTIRITQR